MSSRIIDFEKFEISRTTGFPTELPTSLAPKFKPWHDLASKTMNLMASQTMGEEVQKMPVIDSSSLKTFKELRLAQLQLAIIASGYVWEKGTSQAKKSLPACVSIPLCDVSDRLGVPSGFSYFTEMGNWERVDKNGPYTRDNIKVKYILPGGQQFVDFNILGVYNEFTFTKAFPAIEQILEGSKQSDASKVISGLKSLSQWIKDAKVLSEDFHKIMQADVFYRTILKFLQGFNETTNLPEGMTYEGVTDRPKRKVHNPAASQTTIFQIIDTLLGIEYSQEKEQFFQQIRESWTKGYRDFINVLKTWPGSVKDMAKSNTAVKSAYDETVEALRQFRTYHLQLVTKFVTIPHKRERTEMNETGPDPMAPLMPFLKDIRDVVANSKLEK